MGNYSFEQLPSAGLGFKSELNSRNLKPKRWVVDRLFLVWIFWLSSLHFVNRILKILSATITLVLRLCISTVTVFFLLFADPMLSPFLRQLRPKWRFRISMVLHYHWFNKLFWFFGNLWWHSFLTTLTTCCQWHGEFCLIWVWIGAENCWLNLTFSSKLCCLKRCFLKGFLTS